MESLDGNRSKDFASPQALLASPSIVLELCGEAILNVPQAKRCIGPVSLAEKPLLVGRRHQPDLPIAKEHLEFLSRDHFCVAYEGGEFWLLALTSNRIWRDRDGESPLQLARDDITTLLPGDRIVLSTGSSTTSIEDARPRLCWIFHRAASGTHAPTSSTSPGGAPPWWMAKGAREIEMERGQTSKETSLEN